MPRSEDLFKSIVQDVDSHREKRLNGVPIPAHLLLLDHPFCDDLIHRGLNPSRLNRLLGPVSLAVIWQGVPVRTQILQQIPQRRGQARELWRSSLTAGDQPVLHAL